jgi:omega-6 fatty acid desaturase (delta-12 desaturase)
MGWWQFLLVGILIIALTSSIGVWLFYVQHQFEDTQWSRTEEWSHESYALHGSSYYKLPWVLNWMSGNIGVHHVHHMSSAIPFYRLPQVLRDHPELQDISRITLWQSFKFARLKLWDEAQQKLVTFREARSLRRAAVAV